MLLFRHSPFSMGACFVFAAFALVLASGKARADVTIVTQTTVKPVVTSSKTEAKTEPPTTTVTYYKNDKQRTEEGKTVTIFDGTRDVTYTLDSDAKTYTEAKGLLNAAFGDDKDFLSFLSGIKADSKTVVEPGKQTRTIAGQKTRNYHYISLFTFDVTPEYFATQSSDDKEKIRAILPITVTVDGEEWTAENLRAGSESNMRRATKEMGSFAALFPNTGIALQNYVKQMAAIKGIRLLSTRTTTITLPQGGSAAMLAGLSPNAIPIGPTKTTEETKAISTAKLDDALFTVPADYKKVNAADAPTPDTALSPTKTL